MDTFFATKNGEKSSKGHTCCQLFVTDMGFVYVVAMKRKGKALLAMRSLPKTLVPLMLLLLTCLANKCRRK
jgi:hypothetical protein